MARSFNGTSDRIDIANESNFDFDRTNPFSFAAFFNIASFIAGGAGFFGKMVGSGSFTGITWGYDSSNRQFLQLRASGSNQIIRTNSSSLSTGSWFAAAATFDGSGAATGVHLYENGVEVSYAADTDTLGANSILNNEVLQLGARGGTGAPQFFLGGSMAYAAVWGVALGSSDISTLAAGVSPLNVQLANLKGFWPLGGDATEPDRSGNNNTGTVNGTTVVPDPPATIRFPAVRMHVRV